MTVRTCPHGTIRMDWHRCEFWGESWEVENVARSFIHYMERVKRADRQVLDVFVERFREALSDGQRLEEAGK